MANETTQFLIEREGAQALAQQLERDSNKGLIEAIPRPISPHERWLVNLTTGRIETASPLMLSLGDTCFKEYEPTTAEVQALLAGKPVCVSTPMLMRLKAPSASIADRMTLPPDVTEEQRRRRYIDLHGAPPDEAPAPVPSPAAQAFSGLSLPEEAQPGQALTSAFTLTPMPAAS